MTADLGFTLCVNINLSVLTSVLKASVKIIDFILK